MKARSFLGLFKTAGKDFIADSAPRLGASVAFYTIFSISPLFVIAIGIASMVLGAEAARGQISQALTGLIGPGGADTIEALINKSSGDRHGIFATIMAF